jgi:hypothetical protein
VLTIFATPKPVYGYGEGSVFQHQSADSQNESPTTKNDSPVLSILSH